jgi:hypothetical protein
MDKATGLVINAGTVALSKFVVEAEKCSTTSASRFRSTRTGLYMNLIILVAIIEMDGNLSDLDFETAYGAYRRAGKGYNPEEYRIFRKPENSYQLHCTFRRYV